MREFYAGLEGPVVVGIPSVGYEAAGDNVKVTVDGTDRDGKPTHNEWTGKFDGKDYPITGDPNSDMRSYTKIDDRTLGLNVRKGGKVTTSGRIVVSPESKTRTVTTSGTDPQGNRSAASRCTTSSSGRCAELPQNQAEMIGATTVFLRSSEQKFMTPQLVPTAGGPDVLPNPLPEPDSQPPEPDPTPVPAPLPPVPEPMPA